MNESGNEPARRTRSLYPRARLTASILGALSVLLAVFMGLHFLFEVDLVSHFSVANPTTAIASFLMATLVVTGLCAFLHCSSGEKGLLVSSLVIAALLAVPLHRHLRKSTPFHCRQPDTIYRFDVSPYAFPGVQGVAQHSINEDGARGRTMPQDEQSYRILCVGGSTTECLYLDDREAWPALLEAYLQERTSRPVWVGACGFSSFGVKQHLEFIRQSSLPEKVDCVLVLVGADDLMQNLTGRKPLQAPWYLQSFLGSTLRYGKIADSGGKELASYRRNLTVSSGFLPMTAILKSYKESLRALIRELNDIGTKVVLVSQPALWDDFLTPKAMLRFCYAQPNSDSPNGVGVRPSECRELLDRFNIALSEVCRETVTPFINASSLSGVELNFHDDIHFSERGAKNFAELVANQFPFEDDLRSRLKSKGLTRWAIR